MPTVTRLLAVPAAALFMLSTACSGGDDASAAAMQIDVVIASQEQMLYEVGAGGESVYGWNRLVGEGELDGEPVTVEMLGNVDYVDGGGHFFGFVTITFADGSIVGLRMEDGDATPASDEGGATFASELAVIDGTGAYEGVTGSGTFEGSRDEALGGAVSSAFELDLELP